MNAILLLTPKSSCICLYDDYTLRQSLEHMEKARFATIPLLRRNGEYVGTISEGDILWAIKNNYTMNMKDAESRPIMEISRRKDYLPVKVTTSIEELLSMAVEQNFVPIVDDKESFIGIVTRQKILEYCLKELSAKAASDENR